ncbi:GDSL-type esterase/lipase family protein [Ferrimonas balearica]|uniref:GDSL-type esterase/lipase family protein n=1 Tax=Ferrimonas balearica TaxID=44012 RepID=UPI001C5877B2|nr:GDSL-type esterase/lipase family protein [Ferrimonas balearica]MBW3139846.1 arylesterase [Ferrimonas balearica]MBW3164868.1 arylesterase [Ferrimonas balearica]MBY6224396.1 arylesterase [Ferrimonas balearica]
MRKNVMRAGFLLVALLLGPVGCGGPGLTPLPADGTIVAFGDSLTQGVGAGQGEDYPTVLAQLSGLHVVNAGVSGEQTPAGLKRLPQVLAAEQPDLLLLLLGGNDILRNRPPAAIRDNLAQMIETAQGQGVQVMLVAVPEKRLFSSAAPFYPELAEQYGVPLVDSLVGELLRTPGYKSDPIHLNAEGYRQMAQALDSALRDAGAY